MVAVAQSRGNVLELHLLLLEEVGGHDSAQIVGNVLGLTKVDGVQRASEFGFHLFDHLTNVDNVGLRLVGGQGLGVFTRQVTSQGNLAGLLGFSLNRQHDG